MDPDADPDTKGTEAEGDGDDGRSAARRYAVLISVLVGCAFVGSLLLSVGYTQRVDERSAQREQDLRHRQDQRWCALLQSIDQPQAPATTDRGRLVQAQLHQLRIDLGCVATDKP